MKGHGQHVAASQAAAASNGIATRELLIQRRTSRIMWSSSSQLDRFRVAALTS